jgi:hypothetical protein
MNKEKVRDLARYLHTNFGGTEKLITEFFEQNPQELVVVGLSDEQVERLQIELELEGGWWHKKIQDWLKTQNIVLPFSNQQLNDIEDYKEWYKTQQLTPNWNDAPKSATHCRLILDWCNKEHQTVRGDLIFEEQRPAPKVEVGQVWKYKEFDEDVKIIFVSEQSVGIVMRHNEEEFNKLDHFLAKFELAGGSE